ncbi:MAG: MBL fold metallo-hydrolase, partial [Comamonadaceae bacterium]
REMDADAPWCTPGLRFYQRLMEKDRRARLSNQQRLRLLKQRFGASIQVLSAHDPTEFERVAGRPAGMPLSAVPLL